MVCLYCGHDTQVINSRLQKRLNQVWRRRKCLSCAAVFSTHEIASYEDSWRVQTAAGDLQPFWRDKLFLSLYNSCQHRSHSLSDAAELTKTVISRLQPQAVDGLLPATLIAQSVLGVLTNYDTAAAVHYRAFHL